MKKQQRLPKTITVWKEIGETPLTRLERLRKEDKRFADKDIKLAYAGRLDPMAEGELLVTVGDECKKYNKYLKLDKEYEVEVLLGVGSDTGDVLGISNITPQKQHSCTRSDLVHVGEIVLKYPAYSSKPVGGKPLFLWALEGRLDEIEIPVRESEIFKMQNLGQREISEKELLEYVENKIAKLPKVDQKSKELGRDFRRDEILKRWNEILSSGQGESLPMREFEIVKFRCVCSSGTYMRSLAGLIGEKNGTSGLALSIKRTKIGRWQKLWSGRGFWKKVF